MQISPLHQQSNAAVNYQNKDQIKRYFINGIVVKYICIFCKNATCHNNERTYFLFGNNLILDETCPLIA